MHGVEEPIDTEKALPVLPARLVAVIVSPGALMAKLVEQPKWVGALIVVALVVGVSMLLIPVDLFMEMNRQQALERGVEIPEMSQTAIRVMRIVIPSMATVSTVVFSFVFAGFYTLIFTFILGDEGRYAQYLAVVVHAWFIAVLLGLLVTPLRIMTGDPQFTLNLASFMFFIPDGYFLNVFKALDLSQIWSTLVIAQGVHAIDRRRSFASAATILLAILGCIALAVARFI